MEHKLIEGFTRTCGESQGFIGLHVRDERVTAKVTGPDTPVMVTAWEPTPEELQALNNGASIHIRIVGYVPPPMWVDVGPVPKIGV